MSELLPLTITVSPETTKLAQDIAALLGRRSAGGPTTRVTIERNGTEMARVVQDVNGKRIEFVRVVDASKDIQS